MHLELLYCPNGMASIFTNPFGCNVSMTSLERFLKTGVNGTEAIENEKSVIQKKNEVIVRGVLSVTVVSADDLPAVDLMGKADPYVVLILKKSETRNKTRVISSLAIFSSLIVAFCVFSLGSCLVSFSGILVPLHVPYCSWILVGIVQLPLVIWAVDILTSPCFSGCE